ncbi:MULTISPECIES: Nif11-like leader peptide family RiPP precursor [unclassified Moorena]|uniref:Nif11-like leader peptide family RiPP precursor n=1 Tax=unclassified Moorena TaxID=2683338 RepID=UPI0014001341|nr:MULTISPECIES: Nif11-like leader peptide family RiPP precursor [unclassified Moorena]NEO11621.1 Nif11-like leader peptide family natural product precursor [Moorena sp. SIO3E8]NEP99752.1 Nif11-like leader peptide family natural product precursor [Moorena sp. SIO3F7]
MIDGINKSKCCPSTDKFTTNSKEKIMSIESVLALLKASENDQSLKAQLESAEGPEQVIEIAASQGYNFTEEELLAVMQEQQLEFATPAVELSENAKALMKEVEANQTLRQQFESAGSLADMVKIAIDQGYQVTAEEVEVGLTYFEQEGELSDAELEAVAGAGKKKTRNTTTIHRTVNNY